MSGVCWGYVGVVGCGGGTGGRLTRLRGCEVVGKGLLKGH